jgi:uncharacterized BrkB/YihY/UPF0761 family membrane protein
MDQDEAGARGGNSWLAAGKRSVTEFKNDILQDRAAALTYYSIQSIGPRPATSPRSCGHPTPSTTYPRAGVIIFLIWMWISNLAILLGAQFNAELARGRAIAAGAAPDAEPYVELRDTRKLRKQTSA